MVSAVLLDKSCLAEPIRVSSLSGKDQDGIEEGVAERSRMPRTVKGDAAGGTICLLGNRRRAVIGVPPCLRRLSLFSTPLNTAFDEQITPG